MVGRFELPNWLLVDSYRLVSGLYEDEMKLMITCILVQSFLMPEVAFKIYWYACFCIFFVPRVPRGSFRVSSDMSDHSYDI